ncbi:hypothetical protein PHMEG_00028081 [Phytophthora megakarya]|uniref:PiggyBac transposable element-derived protein domain-containing protein n=1 Tax=Phytophthora megakarya TaxID=4795 RepID=A0A225V7F0_9STRA|nr:hypothetical protein PHMEG_00028081 [Phytophthora megakarya]
MQDALADTTDSLNVDVDGGRDANYDALDSGDEAAKDDVVTDAESEVDDWPSDASAADGSDADPEQDVMDIALVKEFLDEFGGSDAILAGNWKAETLTEFSNTGWGSIQEPNVYNELQTPYVPVENTGSYPGLLQGYAGPTPEVLHRGDSPKALFLYFVSVALWQHIAICSNKYQRDVLSERVDEAYRRHKRRCRANPDIKKKLDAMCTKSSRPYPQSRTRALSLSRVADRAHKVSKPRKIGKPLANHRQRRNPPWRFQFSVPRDRFFDICRNLHFNNNDDPQGLQCTFREGYVPPAELSFDEAMIQSRSSFNKMRVYMKAKPHKFEVCCGKKKHASDNAKQAKKEGPAAVV